MVIEEKDFLKNLKLLVGFTEQELETFFMLLQRKAFLPNEHIIDEGETSRDIYLILEGEVAVYFWDEEKKQLLPLARLTVGDMFGEMAFIDPSPRSTSVRAVKGTVVLKLSPEALKLDTPEIKEIYNKLVSNIAMININRLREANRAHVHTLRNSLQEQQIRLDWGQLIIIAFLSLGFARFFKFVIVFFFPEINYELTNLFYLILVSIPIGYQIKIYEIDLKSIGITAEGWPASVMRGLSIAVVTSGLLYLMNLIQAKPFAALVLPLYLGTAALYEFVLRGVLIRAFQQYFGDEQGFLAVLLTSGMALIVGTNFFSPDQLPAVFIFNLVLGFTYLYQRNLIGVTLMHFIFNFFI